jgi:hypothetical protein
MSRSGAALVCTVVFLAGCSSSGDGSSGASDASGPSDATADDRSQGADAGADGSSDALAANESGIDAGPLGDGDADAVDAGFVCRPDDRPCGDDTDCCNGVCQSVSRVCGCAAFVGSKCDRGPDCCPGMGCSLDTARCAYGGGHTCQQNTDCLSGFCPNGTCA